MEEKIEQLRRELQTEQRVNEAITQHLKARTATFRNSKKDLDEKSGQQKKDDLEAQINTIKRTVEMAQVDIRDIQEKLDGDNNERMHKEREDQKKKDLEDAAIKKKMDMEDAAKAIQAKWAWF